MAPTTRFRWDGQGWVGTDMNKLWFKSEGFVEHGKASDGDTEALYDRPIPFFLDISTRRPESATTSIPIRGAPGER